MSSDAFPPSSARRLANTRIRPTLTALEAVLLYGLACAALPTRTQVTATLAASPSAAARVAHGAACKLYLELRNASSRNGL